MSKDQFPNLRGSASGVKGVNFFPLTEILDSLALPFAVEHNSTEECCNYIK